MILTPFHDATPEEALEKMRKTIPLHRRGTDEDCTWSFGFLASDAMSGYVTAKSSM